MGKRFYILTHAETGSSYTQSMQNRAFWVHFATSLVVIAVVGAKEVTDVRK